MAMDAVMAAERALGHAPRDVSAEKKGWDIESRDWQSGHLRFLEVKGRHEDGVSVILTKNELLACLNTPDAFILAIVRVAAGFAHQPVYVRRFFDRVLGFAETAVVFDVAELICTRGESRREAAAKQPAGSSTGSAPMGTIGQDARSFRSSRSVLRYAIGPRDNNGHHKLRPGDYGLRCRPCNPTAK